MCGADLKQGEDVSGVLQINPSLLQRHLIPSIYSPLQLSAPFAPFPVRYAKLLERKILLCHAHFMLLYLQKNKKALLKTLLVGQAMNVSKS